MTALMVLFHPNHCKSKPRFTPITPSLVEEIVSTFPLFKIGVNVSPARQLPVGWAEELGAALGILLGKELGGALGTSLGVSLGKSLGEELGAALGLPLGSLLGIVLGALVLG
jgi:hypothetical protein